jgi:hypothetical protein
MTFILVWITTFKNGMKSSLNTRSRIGLLNYSAAYRIDASIRPQIRVNYLEQADHRIFDITFTGILIQCICSVFGYSWMYALTRRPKLSILAALPPFLLNILYAGTHSLCGALDVFVGSQTDIAASRLTVLGMALIRRYPLHLSIPRGLLALAIRKSRRCIHFRMVLWHTELPRNYNTSIVPDCSALVRRSIRISSATRKLQHAWFCGRLSPR